ALHAGAAALALPAAGVWAGADQPKPKGTVKQSICRWCYNRIKLEELAAKAKEIGYRSIELIGPDDVKKVQPVGLTCAVLRSASRSPEGLNGPENHAKILKPLAGDLDFAAAEGVPNVLVMSGNRRGQADDVSLAHCADALKRVMKLAEEKQVTVLMEGL